MAEMKIKFLRDHVVQNEYAGTDRETRYLSGKVYALGDPSAQHFLRRGIADVAGRAKAKPKPPPKPVEDSSSPDGKPEDSGGSPDGKPDPMKTATG